MSDFFELGNVTSAKNLNTFTEVDKENTTSNCGERVLNPILLDLKFTKWTCIPSYIMLLISSAMVVYIILKKYRENLNVYFSVLFYIVCQAQFLVITTVSWITESTIAKLRGDCEFEEGCKIKMPFQTYSIILPGYAVLMITIVRTVFVSRPLSYFDYIRRRYQVVGAGLSVILCVLISSLPSMGILCDVGMKKVKIQLSDSEEIKKFRYCGYGGGSCSLYFALLVGLGSVLPVVLTSYLYIYIYRVTLSARKAHESLTKRESNQQKADKQNDGFAEENRRGSKISKERRRPPWSIIAILIVLVVSSTPWILLQVLKNEITDLVMKQRQAGAQIFDAFYAVVELSVGISVLIYLLTTTSLRSACFLLIKQQRGQISSRSRSSISKISPSS